jgi:hypothetical protein
MKKILFHALNYIICNTLRILILILDMYLVLILGEIKCHC